MVTALHDKEIEAKARSMLRETIERSGWYPALHGPKRKQLIERDVEQHWHLMTTDARKCLEQCRKSP
ncbi:hypothetical protein BB934_02340 [Microvirga ossetica]|uniref:Uncharacterized protein n=1 Tax=Microvirga ossetica TaxID=1882682 RepID=A0A1B2EB49_9HYPH|nr:hypothetical protein [Microvirga ossetica]ANY77195.1 hypothetical protein BB934_02340 [Microvirga ossetica]